MLQAKLGQKGYAARLVKLQGELAKYNGRLTHPQRAGKRYQRSHSGNLSTANLETSVVIIPPTNEGDEEVQLVVPGENLEVVEDVFETPRLRSGIKDNAGKGVIIASGFQGWCKIPLPKSCLRSNMPPSLCCLFSHIEQFCQLTTHGNKATISVSCVREGHFFPLIVY